MGWEYRLRRHRSYSRNGGGHPEHARLHGQGGQGAVGELPRHLGAVPPENLRQLYSKRTAAPTKPSVDNFPAAGRKALHRSLQRPQRRRERHRPYRSPRRRSTTNRELPRRKAGSLSAEQAERFDRFYAAYPKKVARATAERAWAKIDPEPDDAATDRIIAAVEAAKKYDSRFRERQFTPNPASWLNAKGYIERLHRR